MEQTITKKSVMNLDQFEKANGIQYEEVEMPAWQGELVGLMSITAGEVLEWLDAREDPEKKREAGLLLIARSLAMPDPDDPTGQRKVRVCKTDQETFRAVEALKNKDSASTNKLVQHVVRINGIEASAAETKNA